MLFRIVALTFIFTLIVGRASASDRSSLETKMQEAFSAIYLTNYGLDYPKYEERVIQCINQYDTDCLKTFNRVMDAKNFIQNQISLDPDHILEVTLDNIFQIDQTQKPNPKHKNYFNLQNREILATGAVISLYFFQTEKQDQVIFERMKTASPRVLSKVFFAAYEWQYNRPNPDRWISFITSIQDNILSDHEKERIINTLKTKEYKKFGIMLDRPPATMH